MLIRLIRNLLARIRASEDRLSPGALTGFEIDEYVNDGAEFHRAGALVEAEAAYRKALQRDPRNSDALHLMGAIALHKKDLDGAESWVRRALEVRPEAPIYMNTLASVLSSMGRHDEAKTVLEQALHADPAAYRPMVNLLFLLNIIPGISREHIFSRHVEWGRRFAGLQPMTQRCMPADQPRDGGILRVGYVSADFCSHPVGRIISTVLAFHDKTRVEVFCYDNGSDKDHINAVCRQHADHWIEIAEKTDAEAAACVARDGIQILVDLSGHTRKNRLGMFARKPAPVQVTWLGYLNTTGLDAMDWKLTDRRADPPPESQGWHIEQLWYLPHVPWVWDPPDALRRLTVSQLPLLRRGFVTFGSFNTFRKLNDSVLATWAEILRRLPTARLRILGVPGGSTVDRLVDQLQSMQVDPERVDFIAAMDYDRYLLAFEDVDIALDPFPYNGGATTCESLWMGVPVISLAGSGGFARTGASLLGALGLESLLATSEDEYIDLAVQIAGDHENLHKMRHSLRERILKSPLADSLGFVGDLESAYAGMWAHRQIRDSRWLKEGGQC
jgi:predicted O-linked N-acetylglucosamine transferase (SPINDLY family)